MFKHTQLIEIIKKDFAVDYAGIHGIGHWTRVYRNTQKLAAHYKIESDVFELFALLHDSKRENEYWDTYHGKRAAVFAKELLKKGIINLSDSDVEILLFACANHTVTDLSNPLSENLVAQICFDSDRLDIGRVGDTPKEEFMSTEYAKELCVELRLKQSAK